MNYNIFTSHWSETYAKHLFDIYNTRDWTGRPHTCRIVWTGRGLETRVLWVVWPHSILPYTTSPTARTGQVENCTPDSLLSSDEETGLRILSIIIPSAEIWYSEDRNCFVLVHYLEPRGESWGDLKPDPICHLTCCTHCCTLYTKLWQSCTVVYTPQIVVV